MNEHTNARLRAGALISCLLVLIILTGCGGGARLMGRLDYADVTMSTAGDSVWVQLQGQENIGATVPVKSDNTWVYQPESKNIRAWSGEYPPLKKQGEDADDPILVVHALTPTHKTKVQYVNYVLLRQQEDKRIRLQYELLPENEADSTYQREIPRVRGGEIRP